LFHSKEKNIKAPRVTETYNALQYIVSMIHDLCSLRMDQEKEEKSDENAAWAITRFETNMAKIIFLHEDNMNYFNNFLSKPNAFSFERKNAAIETLIEESKKLTSLIEEQWKAVEVIQKFLMPSTSKKK